MIEALYIAESGLAAQQSRLDAISNNVANLNTAGFKKATVEFSALMTPELQPGAERRSAQCRRGWRRLRLISERSCDRATFD